VNATIHRFDMAAAEREQEIITHRGAQFLPHVRPSDRVDGGFTLWGVVPVPLGPIQTRYVQVVGTGDTFDLPHFTYLGTYHDLGYVWHVFVDAGTQRLQRPPPMSGEWPEGTILSTVTRKELT
jgi:hypothetical protein